MWDKDGSYTYSNIEKVDIANSVVIKVYPNPAKESVTISGKGIIKYSIIDQIGKVILSKHTPQMQEVVLDISKLSRGIYFLETLSSKGLIRTKLIAD